MGGGGLGAFARFTTFCPFSLHEFHCRDKFPLQQLGDAPWTNNVLLLCSNPIF